jgi:uncharacterized membrane protein HdeD (DUF308 family)
MTDNLLAEENPTTTGIEPPGPLRDRWKPGLVSWVVTAIVGALVLTLSGSSILVAATLFGVFLLVAGLAQLFAAFALPGSTFRRVLLFIGGAMSLVLAALSF